jgi:hypothetical protein
MHGLIFTAFRAFISLEHPEIVETLFSSESRHLATQAYDDEEFDLLLARAARASGTESQELLRRFGAYAGVSAFRLLYPDYYAASSNTREFLLGVEERIHEVVRRTIPGAAPPRLDIVPLGEKDVSITYTSPRRLCALIVGLVSGVARHYGERVEIEQPLCMLRGDSAGCTFFVTLV